MHHRPLIVPDFFPFLSFFDRKTNDISEFSTQWDLQLLHLRLANPPPSRSKIFWLVINILSTAKHSSSYELWPLVFWLSPRMNDSDWIHGIWHDLWNNHIIEKVKFIKNFIRTSVIYFLWKILGVFRDFLHSKYKIYTSLTSNLLIR